MTSNQVCYVQEGGAPMRQRRQFSAEFKARVVLEVLSGQKRAAEVCREHQLKPDLLSRWKADFVSQAPTVFQGDERTHRAEQRIAELERLVGRLTLELEVAKKRCCSQPGAAAHGERPVARRVPAGRGLSRAGRSTEQRVRPPAPCRGSRGSGPAGAHRAHCGAVADLRLSPGDRSVAPRRRRQGQ